MHLWNHQRYFSRYQQKVAFSGTNLLANQPVTSELELTAYEVVWIKKAVQ